MAQPYQKKVLGFISALLITMSSLLSATTPLGISHEKPEEIYSPILGSYEFDMSVFGWGTVNIRFFVENGKLWTHSDMSNSPEIMLRVSDSTFEFMVEDPDEGRYDIIFKQDEAGNYTQCQIKNPIQDIDVVGIKQPPTP